MSCMHPTEYDTQRARVHYPIQQRNRPSFSGVVYAPLVCRRCSRRRQERKEILTEIMETEIKYGRDLRVMVDEFYRYVPCPLRVSVNPINFRCRFKRCLSNCLVHSTDDSEARLYDIEYAA